MRKKQRKLLFSSIMIICFLFWLFAFLEQGLNIGNDRVLGTTTILNLQSNLQITLIILQSRHDVFRLWCFQSYVRDLFVDWRAEHQRSNSFWSESNLTPTFPELDFFQNPRIFLFLLICLFHGLELQMLCICQKIGWEIFYAVEILRVITANEANDGRGSLGDGVFYFVVHHGFPYGRTDGRTFL